MAGSKATAARFSARRSALRHAFGLLVVTSPLTRAVAGAIDELSAKQMVTIENFAVDGHSTGIERVAKIIKSNAEWSKKLAPDVYRITRGGSDDKPYTGNYWNSHADGVYRCACCDTALFDNKNKYESGTGWPSFLAPISALNLAVNKDRLLCNRCDANVGRLFGDGPGEKGLRFTAWSLALRFVPAA